MFLRIINLDFFFFFSLVEIRQRTAQTVKRNVLES